MLVKFAQKSSENAKKRYIKSLYVTLSLLLRIQMKGIASHIL